MLNEIEHACGTPLQASSLKLQHNLAQGGISQEGTPFLQVDTSVTPTEELIVHELSHIQLVIEGFPKLDLIGHPEWHPWVRSDILDVIQHRVFYPRLRQRGFRPDSERILETRRIIAKGNFTDTTLHPIELSSLYFRVAMETDSPECANVFCRGVRTFTFARWEAEKYGAISQRFGVVDIT